MGKRHTAVIFIGGVCLEKKERYSNFEVLRILCMFLIVMHHFTVHGGAIGMEGMTANRIISLIILPLGKICFNCFVALSTWFLVKSTFKASRFLKIWFQVLFYNVVFLALAYKLGGVYAESITWKTWLGAILPICGNSHGYASAYMAFYLTIPFLKMVSDSIKKRQEVFLICILSITQLGVGMIGPIIGYMQPLVSEILLFVLCYYVSDYLQKYPFQWQNNSVLLTGVFLCVWFFTAFCRIWNAVHPEVWFTGYFANYVTGSELSVVNIIAGYALFLLFKNIRMPNNKAVNAVASTMFGILLAHDHNYFRPVLWKVLLKTDEWYYIPTAQFVGRMLAVTILIMTVGIVIEFLRQMLIERPLSKSKPVAMVSAFLDECASGSKPDRLPDLERGCKINRITREVPTNLSTNDGLGKTFSIGVLLAIGAYWLITLLSRSSNIDAYFVTDHGNTSMDYFNMLANLDGDDPWFANANYPAICFLFWRVMLHFVPAAELGDGFYLRMNMVAQLGYILFILLCIVMIWETVRYMAKGTNSEKILFCCAILFSGPMFFLLERGNILIAAIAFSLLFLALYDSDKLSSRIVAYVCLAIAAAIKLYPAILGLMVVSKKRYKEAGLLILLGAAAFLTPFFVFDGIDSIRKMVVGMSCATEVQLGQGFGANYCLNNLVQIMGAFMGRNITSVSNWISVAGAIFCLFLFAISTREWQKLYALVLLCIWFPSFSYTYTLVLLFLPIISFLFRDDGQQGRFRLGYTVAFALTIIPYALPMVDRVNDVLGLDYVKYPVSWGMVIINLTLVLLAAMVCVDALKERITRK